MKNPWLPKRFPSTPSFFLSRWLFLRLLGVVYLAAFLSLWVQIGGLIGSQGILPVAEYLSAIRQEFGEQRYYLFPTLCWLDSGDWLLSGLCVSGAVLSALLILGLAPVLVLFLLWVFYLSLTVAGQVFLGYQWDGLLLETGFLAIFLAPLQIWPRLRREVAPASAVLWLFRWLLFRLMFASGVVKFLSGDEAWRSLTALHYHYETQPLPAWTSWYMEHLPVSFQALSVLVGFAAELLVPLMIFGPRRCRYVAFGGIVGLQLLIAATGNYGFFNLLTIALCVLLLDDAVFPAGFRARIPPAELSNAHRRSRGWSGWLTLPVVAVLLSMSLVPFLHNSRLAAHWPDWLVRTHRVLASFRSVNSYGLFAVMTTKRPEIIVEGSEDGKTWKPYEFRWKPGDLRRRPCFTGLHMPRLDWQLWFAALEDWRENTWFLRFLIRVQRGSREVLELLEHNPFPEKPPRHLRAVLYAYHFTDSRSRSRDGRWWWRVPIGPYCPILSLNRSQHDP
jgi:hypothetical protein